MSSIKMFLYLSVFLFFFTSAALSGQENIDSSKTARLVIVFKGMESDDGAVNCALCGNREEYENHGALMKNACEIKGGEARWVIENLPFGEYAAKSFHDENGNKKMDTNFLGMPSEAYGFSNNARGSFGPPDYKDASFVVNKDEIEIVIKIE